MHCRKQNEETEETRRSRGSSSKSRKHQPEVPKQENPEVKAGRIRTKKQQPHLSSCPAAQAPGIPAAGTSQDPPPGSILVEGALPERGPGLAAGAPHCSGGPCRAGWEGPVGGRPPGRRGTGGPPSSGCGTDPGHPPEHWGKVSSPSHDRWEQLGETEVTYVSPSCYFSHLSEKYQVHQEV